MKIHGRNFARTRSQEYLYFLTTGCLVFFIQLTQPTDCCSRILKTKPNLQSTLASKQVSVRSIRVPALSWQESFHHPYPDLLHDIIFYLLKSIRLNCGHFLKAISNSFWT